MNVRARDFVLTVLEPLIERFSKRDTRTGYLPLDETVIALKRLTEWRPIVSAPKDGRYILIAGDSGYIGTPLRVAIAKWYPEYRPRSPWVTSEMECFDAEGEPAKWWAPILEIPE